MSVTENFPIYSSIMDYPRHIYAGVKEILLLIILFNRFNVISLRLFHLYQSGPEQNRCPGTKEQCISVILLNFSLFRLHF